MGTERTKERTNAGPTRDRWSSAARDESAQGAPDRAPSRAPDGGRAPRHRRTTVAVVAAFIVAIAAAAIGVAVATRDDGADRSQTTGSTAPAATAPSTTDADAGGRGAAPAPPTSPSVESVLEDGRHPVYLTDIDTAARTVEFDLIQFLTGDEATAAYVEDHPDDPGGPPNDYYIVNDNPRLRRLPVAENVQVTVLDWEGGFKPQVIAFGDLPAQLAADDLVPDDDRIWPNPFWLTVNDDTIIAIEEQYIP
jgi:hypothetical protein